MRPLFQTAFEREGDYPPPWGDVTLDVKDFEDVLGEDFVKKYKAREKQYATPLKRRRYCKSFLIVVRRSVSEWLMFHVAGNHVKFSKDKTKCGAFLPPRPTLPPNDENFICEECSGPSCRVCELPLTEFEDMTPVHECSGSVAEAPDDIDLSGLRRGGDYQLCPNPECGLRVQLQAGCNHMICQQRSCKTTFCYICGQEADGQSYHWVSGMRCPRYNQPDAVDAGWDPRRRSFQLRTFEEWPDIAIFLGFEAETPHHYVRLGFKSITMVQQLPNFLRERDPNVVIPDATEETSSFAGITFIDIILDQPPEGTAVNDPRAIRVGEVASILYRYLYGTAPPEGDDEVEAAVLCRMRQLRSIGADWRSGDLSQWMLRRLQIPILEWADYGWF